MLKEQKARLAAAVKAVLPKGWKATFSAKRVGYSSKFTVVIRSVTAESLANLVYSDEEYSNKVAELNARLDWEGRNPWGEEQLGYKVGSLLNATALPDFFRADTCITSGDQSLRHIPLCFQEEKAQETLDKIVQAINSENYSNCDIQSDYFDVGYYVDLSFGTWDKPCKIIK